ncbi:MAG: aminotransferase class I/II-fold pyridoxal phosphate-dependent enzyme [Kiritimatiellae bacterium]|nr:aminotransferase class I/II-fold pyridoxal phosphate-dependent enzyme [Kiritimatiellia bacterium]
MKLIPLIRPYMTQEIKDQVCEVLDSGYLTEGPVTKEFEEVCRQYIQCEHAIAVSNCTVGLEIALRAVGVGPGDEVIVPDYTYPATASVVTIVGAKPVIVDINPDTMLIDYDAVEQAVTSKTKAIIPVSLFGNPLDYEQLYAIKKKHGVTLIEDAACALGADYKGSKVGSLADISVFSLHPRKFITTGEGGLITTHHQEWANWMSSYKHFGMAQASSRSNIIFERIGSNYKLSNVQSAIGLGQMKHINKLLDKRRSLAQRYTSILSTEPQIKCPTPTQNGTHSYQSYCVFVANRNKVIEQTREQGIETQIGTYSLHMHPAFQNNQHCKIYGDLPGSRYAYNHTLTLPLYHNLSEQEQDHVVQCLIQTVTNMSLEN